MKRYLIRQGDVLLIPAEESEFPADAFPIAPVGARFILAEGERTGHAHAVVERPGVSFFGSHVLDDRFLRIGADSPELEHEEHGTHLLDTAPLYRVRGQVEYHPAELRRVAD